MAPSSETPRKIPTRKLPKIKISKASVGKMKTTAAIVDMLADNPDLIQKIAEEYATAVSASREDQLAAGMAFKENVTGMVADAMKKIPADQIEKYYPAWSQIILKMYIPHYWMPHNINYWADQGPMFGQEMEFE